MGTRRNSDEVLLSFGATIGAYAGGTAGYLFGEALEKNEQDHAGQGIVPGGIGVTTAYAIGLGDFGSSYETQTLLDTSAAHGLFYGSQVGRALLGPDEPGRIERIHASGLAGSMHTKCNGTCVVLAVDTNNCGSCGTVCPTGEARDASRA